MYMTDSRSRCTYSRARNGSSTRMIEVVDTREHIRLDDYAGRRRGVRPAPPHGEGERPDGERAPALLHRRRAELAARGVRADGDEAMWKGVPVLGTHAWGLRQQIRDGLDGRLVSDPTDPEEIARTLDEMLADAVQRFAWGAEWAAARARVVSRVPSGTGVAAPARVIRDLDAALLGFPEVMTPMFVQPWRTRKSPRPFPSWPTCSS